MMRIAKTAILVVGALVLSACWGERADDGAGKTVEDCQTTKSLNVTMLHDDLRLKSEPGVCYMVTEQLNVGTDVHLTIEPGVKIIFAENAGLTVHEGALTAKGSKDHPVVFTARHRRPGAWAGIRFMNSAHPENVLQHVVVEYAGATPGYKGVKPANLMLDDYYGTVNVAINNVTLRASGGFGLYAEQDVHSKFSRNVLTGNRRGAAHVHPVFADRLDAQSRYAGNAVDVVELSGATFDQHQLSWPGLEVPYLVTGDIKLTGNTLVEVGAGAVFQFVENTGISVFRSRFAAHGKKGVPVIFTGVKKVPGYWRGIRYVDSNSVDNVLEHTSIRYAGASPTYRGVEPAGLMLDDYYGVVRVRLHNSQITHSGRYGLYAEEKVELEFANNELVDNKRASALVHPAVIGRLDDQSSYAGANGQGRLEILGASLDGIESTWPAIDARYVARGDILIRDDAHVTIEPGATLAFSEGAGLSVYRARLTARGTPERPITFTGEHQKPGYWKGIHLVDTSSVENVFEHVVIEYGGSPRTFKGAQPANLMFDDYFGLVSATLNNVTSRHSGSAGMHIEWGAQIRSNQCSSITIEDETSVTREGKSLRRACRG